MNFLCASDDAENILGFHALMLRPGQVLILPMASPAQVLHLIEGGVDVHVAAACRSDSRWPRPTPAARQATPR